MSSFSLFGKNGRDEKPTHDSGGKGNLGIFLDNQITLTAEYLLGTLIPQQAKLPGK